MSDTNKIGKIQSQSFGRRFTDMIGRLVGRAVRRLVGSNRVDIELKAIAPKTLSPTQQWLNGGDHTITGGFHLLSQKGLRTRERREIRGEVHRMIHTEIEKLYRQAHSGESAKLLKTLDDVMKLATTLNRDAKKYSGELKTLNQLVKFTQTQLGSIAGKKTIPLKTLMKILAYFPEGHSIRPTILKLLPTSIKQEIQGLKTSHEGESLFQRLMGKRNLFSQADSAEIFKNLYTTIDNLKKTEHVDLKAKLTEYYSEHHKDLRSDLNAIKEKIRTVEKRLPILTKSKKASKLSLIEPNKTLLKSLNNRLELLRVLDKELSNPITHTVNQVIEKGEDLVTEVKELAEKGIKAVKNAPKSSLEYIKSKEGIEQAKKMIILAQGHIGLLQLMSGRSSGEKGTAVLALGLLRKLSSWTIGELPKPIEMAAIRALSSEKGVKALKTMPTTMMGDWFAKVLSEYEKEFSKEVKQDLSKTISKIKKENVGYVGTRALETLIKICRTASGTYIPTQSDHIATHAVDGAKNFFKSYNFLELLAPVNSYTSVGTLVSVLGETLRAHKTNLVRPLTKKQQEEADQRKSDLHARITALSVRYGVEFGTGNSILGTVAGFVALPLATFVTDWYHGVKRPSGPVGKLKNYVLQTKTAQKMKKDIANIPDVMADKLNEKVGSSVKKIGQTMSNAIKAVENKAGSLFNRMTNWAFGFDGPLEF